MSATTERAPYVFDAIPCNAVHAAAATLRSHWGESGYSIVMTRYSAILEWDSGERDRYYVFGCRHADGSEWYLCADRYDNVRHAEWDGERFTVGERV
jgi:hypothetical protein